MITFRKPLEGVERPQMEADVTIVGGGPAGLACALRLSQLIDRHNRRNPDAPLSKENINVLEKARELGQHSLSGALLDPRSMDELLPGWRSEAPLDAEVTHEDVYFLTEKGEHRLPLTPPPLQDHGNYVISINRFVKWLGEKVEQAGITVFTGFAGAELLHEPNACMTGACTHNDRRECTDSPIVSGVRTDDKGVDKHGQKKSNFEPGYDVKSKITVLAEGPRGSLTKQLVETYNLQEGSNPQIYG